MGRKMVVRILSISLALIFLSVFVPSLTKGALNPTSFPFGEVEVGSQDSQVLSVTNPNPDPVKVYFLILYTEGQDCGFSLSYGDVALVPDPAANNYIFLPGDGKIAGSATINVDVIFTPTDPLDTCAATLWVVYDGIGAAQASLSGTGLEAPSKSLTLVIDGQDTGVLDCDYKGKLISARLEEIAAKARTHGQYMRWVAWLTRRLHKAGKIDKQEMKAIRKAAAHANIPPVESGLEDLAYNGVPVTDLIKECEEKAENSKQYARCVFDLMKEMKKEGVIDSRKEKHQIRKFARRLKYHGWHKMK